jgi:hypothetical protein
MGLPGEGERTRGTDEIDYRQVFQSSPALFLLLSPDPNFTILDASDAYLRATLTRVRLRMLAVGWAAQGESPCQHWPLCERRQGGTPMPADPSLETMVDAALRQLRERMLRELTEGPARQGTLDEIETVVERLGQEFRRDLQRRLLEERTAGPRENTARCVCGQHARYHVTRERVITTRHGEVRLPRPYYYCAACHTGLVPLDTALGLDAGNTTRQVREWSALLAAQLASFEQSRTLLAQLTGVWLGESTVARTAVAVGTALRQAQEAAAVQHHQGRLPQPAHKPQRLYASFDGVMIPRRDPWKRDGSLGALHCYASECKTAAFYEAARGPEGRDAGVARCTYLATLGDVTTFAPLVAAQAHACGHHWARELIVLADGAAWIWNLAAAQFPTAIQIVDFFHASEHLWTVARACCTDEETAKAWVHARQQELKEDELDAVLAAIDRWEPATEAAAATRATERQYFAGNRERMRYGTFLKQGFHIASGVIEAACRHVVGGRLDQVGMHWSAAAGEAILALRGALRSTHPPSLCPYLAMLA